jgi:hypothetical protein
LNFRNESETGGTLDSRTTKSIGMLAESRLQADISSKPQFDMEFQSQNFNG